jgi:hypothetical protein
VRSTRGARGGYALAREAASISIRDVIEASEMTTFDLHCVTHPVEEERCSSSHNCSIRPVWMLLQRRIDDVLSAVCLADLLAGGRRGSHASRIGGGSRVGTRAPRLGVAVAFLSQWRAERDLQRKAAGYVAALFAEPEQADVEWLAQNATRGDVDHAQWELRYARRALGMIARSAMPSMTARRRSSRGRLVKHSPAIGTSRRECSKPRTPSSTLV